MSSPRQVVRTTCRACGHGGCGVFAVVEEGRLVDQIRPGTDAALALGMLHVIVEEELYDREFVADWTTRSGKLDLWIEQYAEWGYDPLPKHVEPPESPHGNPELVARFPLVLTTGHRVMNYFRSELRQSDGLRKTHPDPLVELHPEAAAARGIADGDWVVVESPRGGVRMRAHVTDAVDPRVVSAEFGWWFPEKGPPGYGWDESNINVLTDDAPPLDPGMGATNLKGLMCEIVRVSDVPRSQSAA